MPVILVAFIASLVVMGVLDGIWLSSTLSAIYKPGIGHLMAPRPRIVPAALFYLLYAAGVTYLIVMPGLQQGVASAVLKGAVLGLMAYATYDLTSLAVMRDWPLSMSVIDIVWGTVLTAVTSGAAVYITQKLG